VTRPEILCESATHAKRVKRLFICVVRVGFLCLLPTATSGSCTEDAPGLPRASVEVSGRGSTAHQPSDVSCLFGLPSAAWHDDEMDFPARLGWENRLKLAPLTGARTLAVMTVEKRAVRSNLAHGARPMWAMILVGSAYREQNQTIFLTEI